MSRSQSFIGAYARNLPATSQPSPSEEVAPQQHTEAAQAPEFVQKTEITSQAPVAVPDVNEWTHSVVVSGVVPDGDYWRIDSPLLHEIPQTEWGDLAELQEMPREAPGEQVDSMFPVAATPVIEPVEQPLDATSGIEPLSKELALEAFGEKASEDANAPDVPPHSQLPPTDDTLRATISARLERLTRKVSEAAQPEVRWRGADWEVDAFEIPVSVAELFFDEQLFRSIAEHMEKSVRTGLESVLVTSVQEGEGRSTVAIGMAIAAAATGLNVAIIDTSVPTPSLIEQFSLDVAQGWPDALRTGKRLETISVVSLEDGVTLVPLDATSVGSLTALDLDQLIETLKGAFDLVLFDAPTIDSWITHKIASAADSSLIVRDVRRTSASEVELAADRLRRMGVRGVGVIENFCEN